MKKKDNFIGEQLAAVLREQTEWERRLKPIEKRIDKLEETLGKLEEYDKKIEEIKEGWLLRTEEAKCIIRDLNKLQGRVEGLENGVAKMLKVVLEKERGRKGS